MCLSVCVHVSADFLALSSPFGEFEASLEPGLARGCCILSFMHPFTQFHAILAISAIFWPISKCWVSKCMYSSWENQWWCFHTLSCKPICNLMQFSRNFMQFWLFKPFLGQFQHVGYQNACTRAEKFIGNTFKKFHARVHAISCNFTQFSRYLGYFSHFWANFNMLGIKKHVLELRNSLVILSYNFTHVFTQFHANFTQEN